MMINFNDVTRGKLARSAGKNAVLALSVCSGALFTAADRVSEEVNRRRGSAHVWGDPRQRLQREGASDTGPTDTRDLEIFLDCFFDLERLESEFWGAAFVSVRDGRVFFQKGYGYADARKTSPILPESTLLQAVSSTNLFLASAADMGQFLIALLRGELPGMPAPPKEPEGKTLYRHWFARHPGIENAIYGFFGACINRRRGFFHTGGRDHHSLLYLLPDENSGFYLVLTGGSDASAARLRTRLVRQYLNRYYPEPA